MLHLASKVNQRLILTNFIAFGLDSRSDVEHVNQVLRRIFLGECLLLRDKAANPVTLGLFLLFAQELETLFKPLNLTFSFFAVLFECPLQVSTRGIVRIFLKCLDQLMLRIHHVVQSVHKQFMTCFHMPSWDELLYLPQSIGPQLAFLKRK